jgi:glycosyltransferase involved in cell wall biosynthesis
MLNGEGSSIIQEAKAGLSCNAGNFNQLAVNIRILAGSGKEQVQEMGENAKKYCDENFNRTRLFKKFEQIYSNFKGE